MMSEEFIVKYCSPTLAGMKTGNMFTCSYRDTAELLSFLRRWNTVLKEKGVRLVPLRFRDGRALIYVYRPSKLRRDLTDADACRLLSERGYCTSSCGGCIARLIRRLCESDEFPHEIGLFLGYPIEDVRGFIENKAADCKLVGCWKVYGDAAEAQKIFERYKKCTRIYHQQWADGKSIKKLTVAR